MPAHRVNDSITWTAGPQQPQVPALSTTASKRMKQTHVEHKQPTLVIGGVSGSAPGEMEEDMQPLAPAAAPALVNWSLNRQISEATARFAKMTKETTVAPKSGLRKAFEQQIAETGSQLAIDGPSNPSKKAKGPQIPPQRSVLSFFNNIPPSEASSSSDGPSS